MWISVWEEVGDLPKSTIFLSEIALYLMIQRSFESCYKLEMLPNVVGWLRIYDSFLAVSAQNHVSALCED